MFFGCQQNEQVWFFHLTLTYLGLEGFRRAELWQQQIADPEHPMNLAMKT